MTIHFHTKHFENNHLPLVEYMFLLLYEERHSYTSEEISIILKVSRRTVDRMKKDLTDKGYLIQVNSRSFKLTNKLYE